MVVEHTTTVDASTREIIDHMLSREYLDGLTGAIDAVSSIEEISRDEDASRITRTVRYEAPTRGKIPKFLKKYENKAPSHVYWEERGTWDLEAGRYTYEIVAQVPDDWHTYYSARGELRLSERGSRSELAVALTFDVNVFGFKRLIERALRPEVERILRLQAQVTSKAFG